MSRSCYSDDFSEDYQMDLFRANVRRSIQSKNGQARLRELLAALDALPEKALAADKFLPPTGHACALGVWADWKTRGLPDHQKMERFQGDDYDTFELLQDFGWPKLVVLDLVHQNDLCYPIYEYGEGPHLSPYAYYSSTWPVTYRRDETDTERYARVRKWVEDHIVQM